MTTPTTQEPQQPLSLVDHLRTTLYNLKAQHARLQDAIESYRSMANPDDDYRDLLTACERTAEQLEQQIAAQEQTIAILSVLEHPDFGAVQRIHRESWCESMRTSQVFTYICNGPNAHAATITEALLTVHAALNPQEGAAAEKGDQG